MKNRLFMSSLLCAGLAIPTSAWAQDACLRANQIDGFNALPGNQSLVVTDRFKKKFKISFFGQCEDLDWNLTLGFKTASTLSCVSRGDQVLSKRVVGPLDRCRIQTVEPYTAAMQKADADKFNQ